MTTDLDSQINALLSEANGTESGTPPPDDGDEEEDSDSSATVHQDGDGSDEDGSGNDEEDPDELKYNESAFQSAREAARDEGRNAALQERQDAEKAVRARLAAAVKTDGADDPAVIRSLVSSIKSLAPSLSDADIEPVVQVARDALSIINDAAFTIVGENYYASINEVLGDDAKSFWDEAKTLDPALDFSSVIDLLTNKRALTSKAIRDASPEDLIKANPKLKEHIEVFGSDKYKAGRKRGQKDPRSNPASEGRASGNGSGPDGVVRDNDGNIDVTKSLAAINSGG